MKQQILQLINDNPKHFSKIIKNTPTLYEWVKSNTKVVSANLSEMIYSAINQTTNLCSNNNTKKFKSINEGYGFCGTAKFCECAKHSVSNAVSQSKQSITEEEKKKITEKRINTTLLKYGVINNGQTKTAKEKHKEHYENKPKKLKVVKLTPYQKLNKKFNNFANIEFVTQEQDYCGVSNQQYYNFKCLKCNNVFSDYIDNGHTPICKTCNPYQPKYVSQQELDLFNYIKSITHYKVIQTDKSIINPYELDIVVPELNIAIEYCGLYWHSEMHKSDPQYHLRKMQLCNNKGYRLITIFEDEWLQKSEIVKNRLNSILNNNKPIYARKCTIKEISFNEAKQFINQYHIQGHSVFKIAFGCFFNDQLVAVMTFGKPRYDKTIDYELIRYCSKENIVGGASKLFSAFIKKCSPLSIVSYCDLRWGTGNLYKMLKFTQVNQLIQPSYAYTDFISRFHRSKFIKSKLIVNESDKLLTERELMKQKNMYRIWDCGHSKYIWNK